jgi:hypothetical protein
MMTYEILGGGRVEAASSLELVEKMREQDQQWVPSVGIEDYMEGVAQRCKIQNGTEVSTDSVDTFLIDMIAGGFLKKAL